ncbi:MAG TPA: ATP-binding protein [Micromonosporaceae bacterium]
MPLLRRVFDASQVTELRHRVAVQVEAAGLRGQRLDDFVLAVNELITNAVRHGGGCGRLQLWRDVEAVVCEVSDHGPGISESRLDDPRRPPPHAVGGWGLWLIRQLVRDVAVRTGPAGTTVRISARVDGATTRSDR